MEKLTESEIQDMLKTVPGWKLKDEKWIERKYHFVQYLNGVEFVRRVGTLSEKENHHPFISIDYKLVTIKLTSWHARGLSELDFKLAQKYDEFYQEIKQGSEPQ